MNYRKMLLPGMIAGALVFALLFTITSMTKSTTAQAQQNNSQPNRMQRIVSVTGQGEAKAAPNMVQVQIGVETEDKTAQAALQENSTKTTSVISSILELNIEDKDIQTTNFSIHSTYDEKGQKVTGYRVTNTVAVKIRGIDEDKDKAGKLLDEVVKVGANSIYGINFGIEDPSALLEEARVAAMENAKEKATQLAEAGDASVGQVLQISENSGSMPVFREISYGLGGAEMAMDQAAAPPMQAGEQTITAQVQVIFELE